MRLFWLIRRHYYSASVGDGAMMITGWHAVLLLLVMMAAVFVADALSSAPLDPYRAPPLFALGSGKAPSGAHCSAVVGTDK